ncbi:uncharacterized protein A4U43_C07F1040 [Asparagus officinalis]|nr:uncharacterized protein A4U43_C07F1040 [Asparagus officinalis]
MCKIQFNKDIGKSILESYSRVLESLAFNIAARIDDLLYVDDLTKHSDQKNATIPYSISVSSTPYATAYGTPSFSPVPLISLARGEKTPFSIRKGHNQGFSVKKVLSDYLNGETRGRNDSTVINISAPIPRMNES